jgi:acetoin utilization deacetylase AcuC-like enzyme
MKIFISPHHALHATDKKPLSTGGAVLEQPVRVDNIYAGLCRVANPRLEKVNDLGESVISRVHPDEYLSFLRTAFETERARNPNHDWVVVENIAPRIVRYNSEHFNLRKGLYLTDSFTQIFARTYEAAYWAVQASANAARSLTDGERLSYALVRPPGHHAYAEQAGGFCFLNNAAIAARQLQEHRGFSKVAILDIDFHHGNGTQEIFYQDPTVFFCSLHGHPDFAYPYVSGLESERGEGPGEGTNVNICLPQGTDTSRYLAALELSLGRIQDYKPQALVLSLGFDTALGDPYGGFEIPPEGFREIGAMLRSFAAPTVIVQEGGYLLEKLTENSAQFFTGLLD